MKVRSLLNIEGEKMEKKPRVFIIKINKRIILLIGIVILLTISKNIYGSLQVTKILSQDNNITTIVLDPGHGGVDGGTGKESDLLEKDINLDVALKLKKELLVEGFNVIMTREEDRSLEDLSNINSSRYKKDLDARKMIINNSRPDVFVSIHANYSTAGSARGVQVYYYPDSIEGEILAENICNSVDETIYDKYLKEGNLRTKILSEDFFIIREADYTGVLVEVGFLSNAEDLELLRDEEYQRKLAFAIKKGILEYLE